MIGQPGSYSEMLWRIFASTMIVGIGCSLILAYYSESFAHFVKKTDQIYEQDGVKLPLLLVALPALLALISRIITLHDRISTQLGIRARFDVNHILVPMAVRVGFINNYKLRTDCAAKRHELMRKVFYRYASLAEGAAINKHLVQAALDQWGWFWCFVEGAFVLLISVAISLILGCYIATWIFLGGAVLFCVVPVLLWSSCKTAAKNEWDEILDDKTRFDAVKGEFSAL